MIGFLQGTIIDITAPTITLLVDKVGYELFVTQKELFTLGQTAELWIHESIREDAFDLFAFSDKRERDILRKLITVSGVGPKTALGLLDASPWQSIVSATQNKQSDILAKLPGIGKKTAEKIVIELSNSFEGFNVEQNTMNLDALEALLQLGYTERHALSLLQEIKSDELTIEEVIKIALKK